MKYSLRIKLAVILFVIVAGAILGNWFINMVFQEKYYISMKENAPDIPATGMAVLHQQFLLVQAIEEWIATLKRKWVILVHHKLNN